MPESIRWLVSVNRTEEAIETLKKIAKTNKTELTDDKIELIRTMVKIKLISTHEVTSLFNIKLFSVIVENKLKLTAF